MAFSYAMNQLTAGRQIPPPLHLGLLVPVVLWVGEDGLVEGVPVVGEDLGQGSANIYWLITIAMLMSGQLTTLCADRYCVTFVINAYRS